MGLPLSAVKEFLHHSYVQAVITRAGATCSRPNLDMGVDLIVSSVSELPNGKFASTGFNFHCQLKATTTCKFNDDHVIYDMAVEDYNKLALWEGLSCCVLILFALPEEEEDWFYLDEEQLLLKRCCYWYLIDSGPSNNKDWQRVKIPRGQMFTPEVVTWLLERESGRKR